MLLSIQLQIVEFIALFISAAILGGAIKFFIVSRKALNKTMEESAASIWPQQVQKEMTQWHTPAPDATFTPEFLSTKKEDSLLHDKEVRLLREQIVQQQKAMEVLLNKLAELELADANKKLKEENEALKEKLYLLEEETIQKEAELHHVKQKEAVAQKMAGRLDEVYKEFEYLQGKIAQLENQSSNITQIELSLTELKEAYEGAKKEVQRKQEKLEEVLAENQQLHQQLSEVEDKLAEANLQRQQLLKKVQYLTETHNDIQTISETNRKLQNELRRISELESMLNIMVEERQHSTRKKD